MGNKVIHFEMAGANPTALGEFYSNLFDWKVDTNNPMNYGMVSPDDAGINGGIGGTPNGKPHLTIYVEVDDLQAALDKAVGLGGTVATPPMEVPGGPKLAHFLDPEGNFVCLVNGM